MATMSVYMLVQAIEFFLLEIFLKALFYNNFFFFLKTEQKQCAHQHFES